MGNDIGFLGKLNRVKLILTEKLSLKRRPYWEYRLVDNGGRDRGPASWNTDRSREVAESKARREASKRGLKIAAVEAKSLAQSAGDDRPLLPDWVSPEDLDTMLRMGLMGTSRAVTVDRKFVETGRALLNAVKAGKLSGATDYVYSFGKLLNDWRKFVREEKNITAEDLDLWSNRATGWQQVLASKGVTISGDNNRRATMRDYRGNDEELDLEIEEAMRNITLGMDLPPGANVTSLEQNQSCPPGLYDYGVEHMRRHCVNVPPPGGVPPAPGSAMAPAAPYAPYAPYFSPPNLSQFDPWGSPQQPQAGFGPIAPSMFNPMVTSYRPADQYPRRRRRYSRFGMRGADDGVLSIIDDRRGGNRHHARNEEERELLAEELHNAGVNVLEQIPGMRGWNPFKKFMKPKQSARTAAINFAHMAPPPPPPALNSMQSKLAQALKDGSFKFGQPQAPRYNFTLPAMPPPPPPPPPSSSGDDDSALGWSPFKKLAAAAKWTGRNILGRPAALLASVPVAVAETAYKPFRPPHTKTMPWTKGLLKYAMKGAAVEQIAAKRNPDGSATVRALIPRAHVPYLKVALRTARANGTTATLGAAGTGTVSIRGLQFVRNPDGSVMIQTVVAPAEVKTLRSILRGVKSGKKGGKGATAVVGCACSSSGDDGLKSLTSSTGAFEKLGCMGIEI